MSFRLAGRIRPSRATLTHLERQSSTIGSRALSHHGRRESLRVYAYDMDYPRPGYEAIIMKQTDVCAGDVLLGYAEITAGESQAQPLGYSHVAVALADQRVLEASTSGVAITTLEELLGGRRTWLFARSFRRVEEFLQNAVMLAASNRRLRCFFSAP